MEKTRALRIMSHNIWCGLVSGRDLMLRDIYFKYDPDIIGLQEMTKNLWDSDLIPMLSERYELLRPETDGKLDNTPLLYRKDRFEVKDSGWHLYTGLNNKDSKSLAWALLRDLTTDRMLGVVSTHFWWKKGAESDLARVDDVRQMMAYVNYMRVKYDVPVVIMGDLNCKIDSGAYNAIIAGGALDMRMVARDYSSRKNTHHPYAEFDEERGVYHDGPMPKGCHLNAIDHMFVFDQSKVNVSVFEVVTDQNALDASDHCPIFADLDVLEYEPAVPIHPAPTPTV